MLTIKYVDPEGHESMSEHEFVWTDRHEEDHRLRVFAGPRNMPRATYDAMFIAPANDERMVENAPAPFGWHTVYVMNRFGATVATYRL